MVQKLVLSGLVFKSASVVQNDVHLDELARQTAPEVTVAEEHGKMLEVVVGTT